MLPAGTSCPTAVSSSSPSIPSKPCMTKHPRYPPALPDTPARGLAFQHAPRASERHKWHQRVGALGADRRARRCLLADLPGEVSGFVFVAGADGKEPPAPHDRPAFAAQLVRQRDRLAARRQLGPGLPLADPGRAGLGGFLVLEPLVFGLALGLGLRHRDVRALPLLLDGMPAVQGEVR